MVAAPQKPVITLPSLHDKQQRIAKSGARFKVVDCGRRFGKTLLGGVVALVGVPADGINPKRIGGLEGGRIMWVAPTYKQAKEGWAYLVPLTRQIPGGKVHLAEQRVSFPGGGSIELRTEGGDPDNLRGAGLDGVVIDEAALCKEESWTQVLRPALADREGWALFISTPRHFNWFYRLFERGQSPTETDWQSWQHPTWDNPFIPWSEIEAARRDMTEEDFDQEFGASFTVVGGAIYRLLGLNRPLYLRPMPEHLKTPGSFVRAGVGLDWGTTRQHNANVTCGSQLSEGGVWIRSSWLDYSGSSAAWFNEAARCIPDYGASFARVDRSQSSAVDSLKERGYLDADKGLANVDERIGAVQSLIIAKSIWWDSNDPGARQNFEHCVAYHRDDDGKVVEEEDDDVDGLGYLIAGFAERATFYTPPQSFALHYVEAKERTGQPSTELQRIIQRQAERREQRTGASTKRRGAL